MSAILVLAWSVCRSARTILGAAMCSALRVFLTFLRAPPFAAVAAVDDDAADEDVVAVMTARVCLVLAVVACVTSR